MDMRTKETMRDRLYEALQRYDIDWSEEDNYTIICRGREMSVADKIITVLATKAMNGDVDAIKMVFDQVDGKLPIAVGSRTHPEDTPKAESDVPVGSWTEIRIVDK